MRLTGTTNQNIGGGGTHQFYNLNISNGTNSVVFSDPIEVSNLLDMKGGVLENGDQVITIGTGSENPGSIAYTSGAITGKLKRYFANAIGSKLFPVGTSDFIRDALIDFNLSSPGSDQFLTVAFIEGIPQDGNGGGTLINGLPIAHLADNGYLNKLCKSFPIESCGRRVPWIAFGVPITALSGLFMWAPPVYGDGPAAIATWYGVIFFV